MQVSALSGHIFSLHHFVGQGLHFRGLKIVGIAMKKEILSTCLQTKGRFTILYLKYFNFGQDSRYNAT